MVSCNQPGIKEVSAERIFDDGQLKAFRFRFKLHFFIDM